MILKIYKTATQFHVVALDHAGKVHHRIFCDRKAAQKYADSFNNDNHMIAVVPV